MNDIECDEKTDADFVEYNKGDCEVLHKAVENLKIQYRTLLGEDMLRAGDVLGGRPWVHAFPEANLDFTRETAVDQISRVCKQLSNVMRERSVQLLGNVVYGRDRLDSDRNLEIVRDVALTRWMVIELTGFAEECVLQMVRESNHDFVPAAVERANRILIGAGFAESHYGRHVAKLVEHAKLSRKIELNRLCGKFSPKEQPAPIVKPDQSEVSKPNERAERCERLCNSATDEDLRKSITETVRQWVFAGLPQRGGALGQLQYYEECDKIVLSVDSVMVTKAISYYDTSKGVQVAPIVEDVLEMLDMEIAQSAGVANTYWLHAYAKGSKSPRARLRLKV